MRWCGELQEVDVRTEAEHLIERRHLEALEGVVREMDDEHPTRLHERIEVRLRLRVVHVCDGRTRSERVRGQDDNVRVGRDRRRQLRRRPHAESCRAALHEPELVRQHVLDLVLTEPGVEVLVDLDNRRLDVCGSRGLSGRNLARCSGLTVVRPGRDGDDRQRGDQHTQQWQRDALHGPHPDSSFAPLLGLRGPSSAQ